MHASTEPETGSTPAPRTGKPWRTALAGLLLLGTAGALMAYGAPSRAAVPSHSQPAKKGALVSATLVQQVPANSYGVDAYRVSYRAVDANGRPVVATSLWPRTTGQLS